MGFRVGWGFKLKQFWRASLKNKKRHLNENAELDKKVNTGEKKSQQIMTIKKIMNTTNTLEFRKTT